MKIYNNTAIKNKRSGTVPQWYGRRIRIVNYYENSELAAGLCKLTVSNIKLRPIEIQAHDLFLI